MTRLRHELASLKTALDQSKASADEMKSQLMYAVAEKENAKKLAKQDIDSARQYGIQKFAGDLLEVADTLELAFTAVPQSEVQAASKAMQEMHVGVDMTSKLLAKAFRNHGLEAERPAVNVDRFDPTKHMALFQLPGPTAGLVGAVLKCGYRLNGRVIRPAQVGVTTAAEPVPAAAAEPTTPPPSS